MIRPTPLRIVDGQVIWPYSLARLKADEPTRSFSRNPLDVELAPFGMLYPQETPRPEINFAVERVIEAQPVEQDGQWLQQWAIEELSPAEQEAYFRQQNPPEWIGFNDALPAEVNVLMTQAFNADQRLYGGLLVGLGQAAQGDERVFLGAWQKARAAGLIPAEMVQGLQMLAVQYFLPASFVAGLGAIMWQWPESPERFDEWTAPDGSEWVYDQPRGANGQYLTDDPETEAVESALQWLPVEVES